jgi:hypothetical protein
VAFEVAHYNSTGINFFSDIYAMENKDENFIQWYCVTIIQSCVHFLSPDVFSEKHEILQFPRELDVSLKTETLDKNLIEEAFNKTKEKITRSGHGITTVTYIFVNKNKTIFQCSTSTAALSTTTNLVQVKQDDDHHHQHESTISVRELTLPQKYARAYIGSHHLMGTVSQFALEKFRNDECLNVSSMLNDVSGVLIGIRMLQSC